MTHHAPCHQAAHRGICRIKYKAAIILVRFNNITRNEINIRRVRFSIRRQNPGIMHDAPTLASCMMHQPWHHVSALAPCINPGTMHQPISTNGRRWCDSKGTETYPPTFLDALLVAVASSASCWAAFKQRHPHRHRDATQAPACHTDTDMSHRHRHVTQTQA